MILGIELLLMNQWFDDPLARFRVLVNRNTQAGSVPNPEKVTQVAAFQGTFRLSFTAMFRKWGQLDLSFAPFAGLAGLMTSWFRARDRESSRLWLILTLWLVLGWLVFALIGPWQNARGGYVFNLTQIRYWYLLVPPVVIGVAGVFHAVSCLSVPVFRRSRSLLVPAVVALVLLSSFSVVASAGYPRQVVSGRDHMNELRVWIVEEGDATRSVAAAHRAIRIAKMYDNTTFGRPLWSGEMTRLHHTDPPTVFLLADEDLRDETEIEVDGVEYEISSPPVEWDLVFVSENGLLALLTAGDRDGLPNSQTILSGPSMPVVLEEGRVGRWSVPESHEGPSRYRVEFEGPVPLGRCVVENQSAGFQGSKALYTVSGLKTTRGMAIDMYCSNSTSILSLRQSGTEEVTILGVYLITSGS